MIKGTVIKKSGKHGITEFEVAFSMFFGLFHRKTDFITSGVRRITNAMSFTGCSIITLSEI
ncbi:hypothetical protein [Methanosarcina lacustris]|uniref:hypothetical protein n=1 Tax=Methanosarcina lacustris TaxID=170861 RepID=UPI0012F6A13A|nr:hypothetical protein [Methanosarcina lacustris]